MKQNALQVVQPTQAPAVHDVRWQEIEDTIRKLYAPQANDAEWAVFVQEANSLGLDPRKREYIAMATGSEPVKDADGRIVKDRNGKTEYRKTYQGYVTVHGARAMAARTGLLDSMETHWCGTDGLFREIWLEDRPPAGCKVTVYLRGNAGRGFTGIATKKDIRTFVKFDQETRQQTVQTVPIWEERPEIMMEVRAEMRALRKAGLLADVSWMDRGIASVSDTGEVLLHDHDGTRRVQESRRTHAIAAGRGVDHDGVRTGAQQLDPDLETLTEADPETLAGTGDMIDVLDADGIEEFTGTPSEDVTGDPYEPAPQPQEQTDLAGADSLAFIKEHARHLDPAKFTQAESDIVAGRVHPSAGDADRLVGKMARLAMNKAATAKDAPKPETTVTDDSGATWDAFWKEARAAKLTSPEQFLEATKLPVMPDDPVLALKALRTLTRKR